MCKLHVRKVEDGGNQNDAMRDPHYGRFGASFSAFK